MGRNILRAMIHADGSGAEKRILVKEDRKKGNSNGKSKGNSKLRTQGTLRTQRGAEWGSVVGSGGTRGSFVASLLRMKVKGEQQILSEDDRKKSKSNSKSKSKSNSKSKSKSKGKGKGKGKGNSKLRTRRTLRTQRGAEWDYVAGLGEMRGAFVASLLRVKAKGGRTIAATIAGGLGLTGLDGKS